MVLRGRTADRGFAASAEAALGAALPEGPRQPSRASGAVIFWTAPTAWLIASETIAAADLLERLRPAVAASDAAAIDVTDSRQRYTIGGARSRDLLARGTALDLHPRALAPGEAALTRFAGIGALLHLAAAGPNFALYIERPYDNFLAAWFERAARSGAAAVMSR